RSIATYSNAMDVGNPSNFERIETLYNHDVDEVRNHVSSSSISDEATLAEIDRCYRETAYVLDPHAAVGQLAIQEIMDDNCLGVVLGTASPRKFAKVIQKVLPEFSVGAVDLSGCKKSGIKNSFEEFKKFLLKS
ncbi:MAG: threonine synthase, partial [Flavobacteriales bacterium]|nr:threonine synthase [Flavobacteriales bacterium]